MSNVVDFVPRKNIECGSWCSEPARIYIFPTVQRRRIRIGPTITIPISPHVSGFRFGVGYEVGPTVTIYPR